MRILTLALAASFLSFGTYNIASAQQLDGRHCQWAFKKLQQHQQGIGQWRSCKEQTLGRGLDGATDKGRTARRAEKAAREAAQKL